MIGLKSLCFRHTYSLENGYWYCEHPVSVISSQRAKIQPGTTMCLVGTLGVTCLVFELINPILTVGTIPKTFGDLRKAHTLNPHFPKLLVASQVIKDDALAFVINCNYMGMMFSEVTPVKETSETPKKTISEFPHTCPGCGNPAYVGFQRIVCSTNCNPLVKRQK